MPTVEGAGPPGQGKGAAGVKVGIIELWAARLWPNARMAALVPGLELRLSGEHAIVPGRSERARQSGDQRWWPTAAVLRGGIEPWQPQG